MTLQDAARPTVLLLLLQKALQLSAEPPSDVSKASRQSQGKQEESWPVALATSVCHQVLLVQTVLHEEAFQVRFAIRACLHEKHT